MVLYGAAPGSPGTHRRYDLPGRGSKGRYEDPTEGGSGLDASSALLGEVDGWGALMRLFASLGVLVLAVTGQVKTEIRGRHTHSVEEGS